MTQPEGGRTVAVQPSNGSGDAASPAEAGGSDAGISSAIVPTTPIDFWQVECGAVASRTVPIENGGTAPLTVRASTTGAGFAAAPGTMTVAPAASAILTVTANVPTSATAGSPLSGSLTLETNDPSTPTIDVDLAVTPLGATLTFDPEGVPSPSEADFGPHLIGEDAQEYATIRLYLINSGNEAAVVSISGQGTAGGVSGWPTPPVEFVETSSGPMTCATPTAIGAGLSLYNPGATDVTLTSIVFDTPGYSTSISAGMKVLAGGQLIVPIAGPTPPATPGPATYEAGLVVTTDAPGDVPHPIRIVTKCL